MIEDGETAQFFATNAIHTQHIDSTYDFVNFDDPISTLFYYQRLRRVVLQYHLEGSRKEFDQWLEVMLFLVLTQKDSKISAKAQAYSIMRSAAEKIHNAFRTLNQDSCAEIVVFVMGTIVESDSRLISLVGDYLDETK